MLDIKQIPLDKINQNKNINARFVRMKNMMDVKMAIEYHGLQAVLDSLFSDNTYSKDLENYLTNMVKSSKIVSVEWETKWIIL